MSGELLPKCIVCGKTPEGGLHEGIWVARCFICQDCEGEIIRTESNEPRYQVLLNQVKRIWA